MNTHLATKARLVAGMMVLMLVAGLAIVLAGPAGRRASVPAGGGSSSESTSIPNGTANATSSDTVNVAPGDTTDVGNASDPAPGDTVDAAPESLWNRSGADPLSADTAPPFEFSEADFAAWLEKLEAEANAQGVSRATLRRALEEVRPIPRVIELDRNQPEFTLTFGEYLGRVVRPARVEKARRLAAENRPLLEEIGQTYGVPVAMIVALWGIETDFGTRMGDFPVVPALVTLAYDGRRSAFFRGELLLALRILEEGHIAPDSMIGSWAGAMGQNQFMPSSFVNHAVDYDKDGRQDIWYSRPDVFASTANYLARSGWQRDQRWGEEAFLPAEFDTTLADGQTRRPLAEWIRLGIRPAAGKAGFLDPPERRAAVIRPGGAGGPAYVIYDNFEAILRWNRSTFFAVAAGTLADRIRESS